MIELTSADQLVVNEKPLVVKFGATWCGPCKKLQPTLDKLESEFTDVAFYSVDVDDAPELSKLYSIKSLPTVLFFKNGSVYKQVVGLSLIDPLRKILREISDK